MLYIIGPLLTAYSTYQSCYYAIFLTTFYYFCPQASFIQISKILYDGNHCYAWMIGRNSRNSIWVAYVVSAIEPVSFFSFCAAQPENCILTNGSNLFRNLFCLPFQFVAFIFLELIMPQFGLCEVKLLCLFCRYAEIRVRWQFMYFISVVASAPFSTFLRMHELIGYLWRQSRMVFGAIFCLFCCRYVQTFSITIINSWSARCRRKQAKHAWCGCLRMNGRVICGCYWKSCYVLIVWKWQCANA